MAENELVSFTIWSGITAVLMVITGLVYRSYQRKKSNENFTS